jgi:hypothetical protein
VRFSAAGSATSGVSDILSCPHCTSRHAINGKPGLSTFPNTLVDYHVFATHPNAPRDYWLEPNVCSSALGNKYTTTSCCSDF